MTIETSPTTSITSQILQFTSVVTGVSFIYTFGGAPLPTLPDVDAFDTLFISNTVSAPPEGSLFAIGETTPFADLPNAKGERPSAAPPSSFRAAQETT